jgi:hypothetical protein
MDTFFGDLELSALGNLDGLFRLVARPLLALLNLLDDIVSLEDFAEDDMATIEPAGNNRGDKELGSIGVFSAIGHAWRKESAIAFSESKSSSY